MATCKANSCYNSTNYSWNDYCSYHERCLARLRRSYSSFSNIEALDTFETWFNGNCGWVVTYDYSSSSSYPYYVWIVVYEPSYRSISDDISAIKYDNYSSSSYAKEKAQELKRKLQNSNGWYDYPMLEVHPKANSYERFSSLITSPYVERRETGSANVNNYIFFINGSGTTPSNLDRYFKPLDIVKIREAHKVFAGVVSGITYYHFGIYLGDVGNGKRICHFTSENNGVRLTDWEGFLKDRIGELYRYHPTIPFKYPRRIAEQIAWAYSNDFREGQYDLRNRNCEHFANMCVYGVNFSEQVDDRKEALAVGQGVRGGLGATYFVGTSLLLAPFTGGLSLAVAPLAAIPLTESFTTQINNNKGSTIKLTSEMNESNGKLGEKDNWLSDRIKANIEVPSKDYCRIM